MPLQRVFLFLILSLGVGPGRASDTVSRDQWHELAMECYQAKEPDYDALDADFERYSPDLIARTYGSNVLEDHLVRAVLSDDEVVRLEAMEHVLTADPAHVGAWLMAVKQCHTDPEWGFCTDELWLSGLVSNPQAMESFEAAIELAGGREAPADIVADLLIQAADNNARPAIPWGYYSAISANAQAALLGPLPTGSRFLEAVLISGFGHQMAMPFGTGLHTHCSRVVDNPAAREACLSLLSVQVEEPITLLNAMLTKVALDRMDKEMPGIVPAALSEAADKLSQEAKELQAKSSLAQCLMYNNDADWIPLMIEHGELESLRMLAAQLDAHLEGEPDRARAIRQAITHGRIGDRSVLRSDHGHLGEVDSSASPRDHNSGWVWHWLMDSLWKWVVAAVAVVGLVLVRLGRR